MINLSIVKTMTLKVTKIKGPIIVGIPHFTSRYKTLIQVEPHMCIEIPRETTIKLQKDTLTP